jgi:hypothetical protein
VTAGLKCAPEIGPKVSQRDERRACRHRVREQDDGDVAPRQPFDALAAAELANASSAAL